MDLDAKSEHLELDEWKKVVTDEYPHLDNYSVNTSGCVRRDDTNRILKQGTHHGYQTVTLLVEKNKKRKYLVSRLVAKAFISNPSGYSTVDHINNIKSDNYVGNLRWANMRMQSLNKKVVKPYNKTAVAKYNIADSNCQVALQLFESCQDAADSMNGNKSSIKSACCGRVKSCYGFQWKYYDPFIPSRTETWINVNGVYEISDLGRFKTKGAPLPKIGQLIEDGYRATINGKQYPVHRLVAQSFIPIPVHLQHIDQSKLRVVHVDNDIFNNDSENLAWKDYTEVAIYTAVSITKNCIPVEKVDTTGVVVEIYRSIQEAAKANGVLTIAIDGVCRGYGKGRTVKGFVYRFQ